MRQNTRDLIALPNYSQFAETEKRQWSMLRFNSTKDLIEASAKYARTNNEILLSGVSDPHFAGIYPQTIPDLAETHIAKTALQKLETALAAFPDRKTRPGDFRAAITGGFWDTPSVIAGLPLAARTRVRTKLPPRDLRISFSLSAMIDADDVYKVSARMVKAIHNYILAGGIVNLTVFNTAEFDSGPSNGTIGAVIATKINTADLASLALSISPTMHRHIAGPLITALASGFKDVRMPPDKPPVPNTIYLGGSGAQWHKAAQRVLADLAIV